MMILFNVIAILLSATPHAVHSTPELLSRIVPEYDYLCNGAEIKVCHPISVQKYVQCYNSSAPVEITCPKRFHFCFEHQKCDLEQYGDCHPTLSIEEARKIRCPLLIDPIEGKFHCSEGNGFESICLLACAPGFQRHGLTTIKCVQSKQKKGIWSGAPGDCVPEHEGEVLPHKQSNYCKLTEFGEDERVNCEGCDDDSCPDGAKCHFVCSTGSDETAPAICKHGNWLYFKEVCQSFSCQPFEHVPNGNIICSDGFSSGSRCTLKCNPGYELIGSPKTSCAIEGKWDQELGICEKYHTVTCNTLEDIEHGKIVCSDNLNAGSVCKVSCEVGYDLIGQQMSSCRTNGEWDEDLGFCEKMETVFCDRFRDIDYRKIVCSDDWKEGSICEAFCNAGYRLIGAQQASCMHNGNWNQDLGYCEKNPLITCKKNIDVSNGKITCSDKRNSGSVCAVSCNSGFRLIGEQVTSCTIDGSWDKELGYCKKINKIICPALEPIENGHLICSNDLNSGSICKILCEAGYDVVGEQMSFCRANGKWSRDLGFCHKRISSCKGLENVANGKMVCSDFRNIGSVCKTKCDVGYEPVGPLVSTCMKDGNWNKEIGFCRKIPTITCSELLNIKNGIVSCSDNLNSGSVCSLSCYDGYDLIGSRITSCTVNGNWEAKLGFCQLQTASCEELNHSENAQFVCSDDWKVGSFCTISCDVGYKLVGSQITSCTVNGNWDHELGKCEKMQLVSCLRIDRINGQLSCSDDWNLGSICAVSCNAGYTVTGSKFTSCSANGNWEEKLGFCEKIKPDSCVKLRNVMNGEITCSDDLKVGSICSVSCDIGYEVIGAHVSACTISGDWEREIGRCEKILVDCSSLAHWPEVECDDKCESGSCSQNSICQLRCENGKVPHGYDETICKNGEWSVQLGKCVRKCSPLTVRNGYVECSNSFEMQSTCQVLCINDYRVSGNREAVCLSSGTWSTKIGTCERNSSPCERLEDPSNGKLICMREQKVLRRRNNFEPGTQCHLDCEENYRVDGPVSVYCTDSGKWNTQPGSCFAKCSMSQLDRIESGLWNCWGTSDLVCESQCFSGYEGDRVKIRCSRGVWDKNVAPVCTKRVSYCPELDSPSNGRFQCSNSGSASFRPQQGTQCVLACDDGYSVDKSASLFCDEGKWIGSQGSCMKKCPSLLRNNGFVQCTKSFHFTSECQLQCRNGYHVSGHRQTTCTDSGSWSSELGNCEKNAVPCTVVSSPPHGRLLCRYKSRTLISGEPLKAGTQCRLICDEGFHVLGSRTIQCRSSGSWSGNVGQCERKCSKSYLPLPKHGYWRCDEERCDGGKCQMSCDLQCFQGYTGAHSASCTDGRWNQTPRPLCSPKTNVCPALESPSNGILSCDDPQSGSGSKCELRCSAGFSLSGNRAVSCGDDGEWTGDLGQCQPECDQEFLPSRSNGYWSCQGYETLVCNLKCVSGYVSLATDPAVCMDGEWKEIPTNPCVPLDTSLTSDLPSPRTQNHRPKGSGGSSCKIPPYVKEGVLKCPHSRRGRVDVGKSCMLVCDRRPGLRAKFWCTPNGWTPSLERIECPSVFLYTYETLCKVPDVGRGSTNCSRNVPPGTRCKLSCDQTQLSWADYADCQSNGHWDNYLKCS